jgi:hypothetical protein
MGTLRRFLSTISGGRSADEKNELGKRLKLVRKISGSRFNTNIKLLKSVIDIKKKFYARYNTQPDEMNWKNDHNCWFIKKDKKKYVSVYSENIYIDKVHKYIWERKALDNILPKKISKNSDFYIYEWEDCVVHNSADIEGFTELCYDMKIGYLDFSGENIIKKSKKYVILDTKYIALYFMGGVVLTHTIKKEKYTGYIYIDKRVKWVFIRKIIASVTIYVAHLNAIKKSGITMSLGIEFIEVG